MEIIDVLGKPCPIPVIETKKVIKNLSDEGGTVKVLVDNDIARQNLEKMADGMNLKSSYTVEDNGNITVIIEVTKNAYKGSKEKSESLSVAIGSEFMGTGDETLGRTLMKSFIFSLTELDTPPENILFFNSGAFLTKEGSGVVDDLKILAAKGTKIGTCGACINFYKLSTTPAVGDVLNMYSITETLSRAGKVINLN